MSDLIERQAAIDVVKGIDSYFVKYIEELPSAQPERKPSEWLHDLLQDAIDDGIITEVQASRLMDMIAEDNT